MGDDGLGRGLQDGVAARVVAVVVRVDHDIEHAISAARETREEKRRRIGKLRVDGREHVFVGEPADAAAAGSEEPDVAP